MWYIIYAQDNPNSLEKRLSVRSKHLDRLKTLEKAQRLLVAGPMPLADHGEIDAGFSGSAIIAKFDSLQDAQNWANSDPYIEAGVYLKVDVRPFIKVLPQE